MLKKLRELRCGSTPNQETNFLELKYFTFVEFDSPDEIGSGANMNRYFLEKLDYARGNAGIPFKITSGYRTEEWNQRAGGRVGSSHTGEVGYAADIACIGSRDRYIIVKALMDVGINRIGIGKAFIHCDVDKNKDANVIWLYN